MALLFDEAQGAFKDTGSRTSPMKKSTGLMRKQMSKMDEVAPRGHTLAYITPEEAQILNKGGGGIDTQGNQMQGPYGVPMYQGFMDRQRKSREARKKESKSSAITKASSYSSAPPGEKGGGGYVAPSKPLEVTLNLPSQTGEAPPGEKGGGGYVAPPGFVDRQKKTREAQDKEKKKTGFVDRQKKTREAQDKEITQEDETLIDSGEFLKDWWRKREKEKKQLLPVERPKIRIAEFNLDKYNKMIGGIVGGVFGRAYVLNPSIMITSPRIIDELSNKEKGIGIFNFKNRVSNDIIEFIQENAPSNMTERKQMENMLNQLPQNIQDNIKKAVSEGELSFDVVSVKPFGVDGVTKLASGDLILDKLPEEFQVATTGSLRGLL